MLQFSSNYMAKIAAFFYFQAVAFAVCICACEENEGFQREHPFDAGFPIGVRASLLAHDFPQESLVCYTFASGKRFFAAVGQAGFVT